MRYLVTGSSGHLGEGLVRTLTQRGEDVEGLDLLPSPHTHRVGSICDRDFVAECMKGVDAVIHAATLHKPHVHSHSKQDFIDTNIQGTLTLLEAAVAAEVGAFVFSSTTSAFGKMLTPPEGGPAIWIDESVPSVPKNIYGTTKVSAEDLCELFARTEGLPCVVLRNARFFPEEDDDPKRREGFEPDNLKAIEYLYRRLDLEDAVEAHILAAGQASSLGFDKFVLSATTPFGQRHLMQLRTDATSVVGELFPDFEAVFEGRGWTMLSSLDRVYVNRAAREKLGWKPKWDFAAILERIRRGESIFSDLALTVGSKGYHRPAR